MLTGFGGFGGGAGFRLHPAEAEIRNADAATVQRDWTRNFKCRVFMVQ